MANEATIELPTAAEVDSNELVWKVYEIDEEPKKLSKAEAKALEDLKKRWLSAENRPSPPVEFNGVYCYRTEYINATAISEFLGLLGARQAFSEKRGSLAQAFMWLLRRSLPTDVQNIRAILVLSYRTCRDDGRLTRCHTGLNKFPVLPNRDVRSSFGNEISAGVPRSHMGRSAFSYGSLVKLVCRQGMRWCDVDGVRAFIQLRLAHLPRDVIAQLRVLPAYVEDPEAVMAKLGGDASLKDRLTALSNLQKQDNSHFSVATQQWLEMFRTDNLTIFRFERSRNEDLYQSVSTTQHPLLSMMAALDHDREARVISQIDFRFSSNEHDGIAFPVSLSVDKDAILNEMRAKVAPFQVKMKRYPPVLAWAKIKHPHLDWSVRSSIPGTDWINAYMRVLATRRPAEIQAIDSQVLTVLSGRTNTSIHKRGKGKMDIFSNGQWQLDCESHDYEAGVLSELKKTFGVYHYDEILDQTFQYVRQPFESLVFSSKMATHLLRHLPYADAKGIDSDNFGLLLDQSGNVEDFNDGVRRRAVAHDRLYRHCPWTFASFELETEIDEFCKKLAVHFEGGHAELSEALVAELDILKAHDACKMLRALGGVFEDADDEIYYLRIMACTIIGIPTIDKHGA